MRSLIEQQIIKLMKVRDKAFVGLLYDNYAESLYGVVLRIVKDEAVAQDVMQESFMKIWKRCDQYNPKKARLFTWILTICRNTAIDKLRSSQSRSTHEVQMDDSYVHIIGGEEIQPQFMDIKDHLDTLDHKYVAVINALFFQGMTQQEASKTLNIPLGTIKSRLKIALRELRFIFNEKNALLLISLMICQ